MDKPATERWAILDFNEMTRWSGGNGFSWTICKSAATHSRQIIMPGQNGLPDVQPVMSIEVEGITEKGTKKEDLVYVYFIINLLTYLHTHTHTHTQTVLRLSGFCPGQPGWASTRRSIHPLTPIVIINHPLSASSIYYDPWHRLCSIYLPDSLFSVVYGITVTMIWKFWSVHRKCTGLEQGEK